MFLVVAAHNHTDAEGTYTARLRVLLEEIGDLLAEHEGCDAVHEASVVHLDVFSGLEEHGLEVGTDTTVGYAHVLTKVVNLVD